MESESALAFQAWQIFRGEPVMIGTQVSYLAVTEGLFSLFGAGQFGARFWPAMAGSLLVWFPFLIRKKMDRVPALLLAAGLAFDPALVSVSRIADSPMTALVFLFLAAGAFHTKKISWTVLFLGLGLISGPAFWFGTVLLTITLIASGILGIFDPRSYIQERLDLIKGQHGSAFDKAGELAIPVVLVISLGSFFFTNIQGLSAWMGSLPVYIASWSQPGGIHPLKLIINLVVGNPLILLFAGLGIISSWREGDQFGKLTSIWFGVALVMILIYPGRQAMDLIWVVFPLWIGSVREFNRIYHIAKGSWVIYVLAAAVGVLMVLNWLTFTGMVFQLGNNRAVLLQGGLIAASLALVLLSMAIVASEWGWTASKKGLALGIGSMLVIYMFASLVQGAYLRAGDPRSLWSDGSGAGQLDLLLDSIDGASLTLAGRRDNIAGTVIHNREALRWALRDQHDFVFQENLDPLSSPPILITSKNDSFQVDPELYRGQDFVLATSPGWTGYVPEDWISWVAYRSGPLINEHIILWVRNDINSGY
ncbi:MAG: hypothetical protein HQ574_03505 [Chloroflexi bacterium]|nr:hypothetical protein [Chloroflexota bacterium]